MGSRPNSDCSSLGPRRGVKTVRTSLLQHLGYLYSVNLTYFSFYICHYSQKGAGDSASDPRPSRTQRNALQRYPQQRCGVFGGEEVKVMSLYLMFFKIKCCYFLFPYRRSIYPRVTRCTCHPRKEWTFGKGSLQWLCMRYACHMTQGLWSNEKKNLAGLLFSCLNATNHS